MDLASITQAPDLVLNLLDAVIARRGESARHLCLAAVSDGPLDLRNGSAPLPVVVHHAVDSSSNVLASLKSSQGSIAGEIDSGVNSRKPVSAFLCCRSLEPCAANPV